MLYNDDVLENIVVKGARFLTEENNFLSAAVVTYCDAEKAVNACNSIIGNTKRCSVRLYVFDNASPDGTAEKLSCLDGAIFEKQPKNLGFGAAHNRALSYPLGKYHFVINPDITFSSDVLSDMADFMEQNPDVVMMMPRILNADGTEQRLPKEVPTAKRLFLGRIFPSVRREYVRGDREINSVDDIDFCSGCFFCIRSDIFKKLGGFDERYFMYLEDADLTLRAKKYGRVVINPDIAVTHLWERSSSKSLKYLIIHMISSFKFLIRKGKLLK